MSTNSTLPRQSSCSGIFNITEIQHQNTGRQPPSLSGPANKTPTPQFPTLSQRSTPLYPNRMDIWNVLEKPQPTIALKSPIQPRRAVLRYPDPMDLRNVLGAPPPASHRETPYTNPMDIRKILWVPSFPTVVPLLEEKALGHPSSRPGLQDSVITTAR